MATIKQWDKELQTLNIEEVQKIATAIDTLLDWDMFREEYSGMGIDIIGSIADYMVIDKKREQKKGA
jgi:hypothetical protein